VTPEGKVKAVIKRILDPLKPLVWYDMPVPGGWGKSVLDFVGSAYGHPFAIEAKAAGGKATPRQHAVIRRLEAAGVQCFVVAPGSFGELELWLQVARLHDRSGQVMPVARELAEIIDEVAEYAPSLHRMIACKR
jgi:hypothetical protein